MAANVFDTPISLDGLRNCQRKAYEALLKYFATSDATERNVLIELPTGTGKTGLVAVSPFGLCKSRVLVLTPNLKLAKDLAESLDIVANPDNNVFRKFQIISPATLEDLELFVLKLEGTVNKTDILEHQLIVANYQQLQDLEKWFAGSQELIDLIIIDEAHHQAAATYQEILKFFPNARVVGLTATPFRSDGRPVEGKTIFKYHFHEAISDKIIRNVRVVNVTPREIELQFTDESSTTYALDDILKLKEEAWFNRGIALSSDCCDSIARKAKEKLEELRKDFPEDSHQIIAAAISKRHAREFVKPAFERLGLQVGMVSSADEDKVNNDAVFDKLKRGKLDVIVHIGMLGEGFDHPPLGVAAIFRPYKSLNPYMQFVGRVIRRNGSTAHSYVVSHLGLNQLRRFEEFKLFDYEDQAFLQELLPGIDGEVSFVTESRTESGDGSGAQEDTVVIREIGTQVIDVESQFVSSDQKIESLIQQVQTMDEAAQRKFLEKLGVDPDGARIKIKAKPARFKPIDKRRASRNLLNEKEKSIAVDILKELKLKLYGRDFNPLYPNFGWVKKRVSKTLDKAIEMPMKKRKDVSNEQYAAIESSGVLKKIHRENLDYFRAKL